MKAEAAASASSEKQPQQQQQQPVFSTLGNHFQMGLFQNMICICIIVFYLRKRQTIILQLSDNLKFFSLLKLETLKNSSSIRRCRCSSLHHKATIILASQWLSEERGRRRPSVCPSLSKFITKQKLPADPRTQNNSNQVDSFITKSKSLFLKKTIPKDNTHNHIFLFRVNMY